MNKMFFNYILLSLSLITCFIFNAAGQNIQVTAKLDSTTIRIGDQTRLRLAVHQPVKEHVNFPKLADTITGKLQILGSKTDTLFDQNDRTNATVIQSYTITGFDQGTYTIPSYAFGTAGGVLKNQ